MRTEQGNIGEEPLVEPVLSAEEVKKGEEVLRQKLYAQEEVMKKLGFLPDSFDANNFDKTNYELSETQEKLTESWATSMNEQGETHADIFNRLYAEAVKKEARKIISTSELNQIVEGIVAEFTLIKDVFNPS